jgi:hypothetical protein
MRFGTVLPATNIWNRLRPITDALRSQLIVCMPRQSSVLPRLLTTPHRVSFHTVRRHRLEQLATVHPTPRIAS